MRKQEITVITVSIIDIVSIISKFVLATVTGSLSLLADAWHSIGDLITSILVYIALVLDRLELKKASESVQNKVRIIRKSSWEPRVCLVIGLALIAVAAGVFKKVYSTGSPEPLRHPVIAGVIVIFLMILSYIRFKFEESVGKETNSPALIADAYHSRVDLYVLGLILVSLIAELIQFRIDRWIAGYISLMILFIALKTLYRSLNMMFRLSSQTEPENRTIEDSVLLLMMGHLNTGQNWFFTKLDQLTGWSNLKNRQIFIRRSIFFASLSLFFVWLSTGFFIVSSSQNAIVERFGKPIAPDNPVKPGLHYSWPYPISMIRKVDVKTVKWMRLGYQTKERKDLILWTNAHYVKEFSVLSGDGAIIDLAANLHYRISNPGQYLYSCKQPEDSLEMLSNEVLRDLSGRRPLFELLTHERDVAEEQMIKLLQQLVSDLRLGLEIVNVCFLDMHPPIEVAPAFEDVVSAQEELETFVEQAHGYQKEMLPLAHAEKYTKITDAQAYKFQLLMRADGRRSSFSSRSTAYKLFKSITHHRMRMEAIETWLPNKKLWIIDSKAVDKPLELFVTSGAKSGIAPQFIEPGLGGESNFEP